MPSLIVSNPAAFRDALLCQAVPSSMDSTYGSVLRVLLYYVWRGCTLARTSALSGKAPAPNALIALSAYKALLPIVQLIRFGYHADAVILTRALMERIAIVGYLAQDRKLIPKFFKGGATSYREALAWAKRESLQNWMVLYGILTDVAHSRLQGIAGHVFDATPIGQAFREPTTPASKPPEDMAAELLALAVYALMALDPVAFSIINEETAMPVPGDPSIVSSLGLDDAKAFQAFLQSLAQKYGAHATTLTRGPAA